MNMKRITISVNKEDVQNIIDCYEEDFKKLKDLQQRIDKAIRYFEINKQECIIGRNKDDKLIKDYYLPSQLTPKIIKILKGDSNE